MNLMGHLPMSVQDMNDAQRLTVGSAAVSIGSSLWAVATSPDWSSRLAGLLLSGASFLVALASFLIPILKTVMEDRRIERAAKEARHDLSGRLSGAMLLIEANEQELGRMRSRHAEEVSLLRAELDQRAAVLARLADQRDLLTRLAERVDPHPAPAAAAAAEPTGTVPFASGTGTA